jgi:hypothetical protein
VPLSKPGKKYNNYKAEKKTTAYCTVGAAWRRREEITTTTTTTVSFKCGGGEVGRHGSVTLWHSTLY